MDPFAPKSTIFSLQMHENFPPFPETILTLFAQSTERYVSILYTDRGTVRMGHAYPLLVQPLMQRFVSPRQELAPFFRLLPGPIFSKGD
jgi:hypothetical protein